MQIPHAVSQELLQSAPDAAIVTDERGEIVFANRKALILFGFEAGELIGQPIEMLVPKAQQERHNALREAYNKEPHVRPLLSGLELEARRKDGAVIGVEIALTPIDTDDGLLFATTIRERDRVSGSDAYFRTLLDTAPDALIIVDRNGLIAVVNAQTERMFGYARDQLYGKPVEMLLPSRLRDIHKESRSVYTRDPTLRQMGNGRELLGMRRSGEEFPVEISLAPVTTEAGRFVSSTIRDVTERDLMEKQIIGARQEAERANKANTAFLAAASHDLRQPVQALSLLNGALRRTVTDERALKMIESQAASLTAMTNLLNSLLDISRLDAGAIAPEFEDFPISRLVDRLGAEFGRQAKQKGLNFRAERADVMVHSDPSLLGEVVQNLVSNAIRYTESGDVVVRCLHVGDTCRVEVRDTGVGIAEGDVEAIFLEFNQGSRQTANKEGFGLGLAIVRRLGELLGITIDVESTLGEGSCFSLEIPAVGAAEKTSSVSDSDILGEQSGLVLLVEDNTNVADAWSMLLDAEGYTVRQAVSAQETARLLDAEDTAPSLVITDFHLAEDSTGIDVIKLVRARFGEHIPAFIVSGDTSKVINDARLVKNAVLFSKPINPDELLAAARDAITSGHVTS